MKTLLLLLAAIALVILGARGTYKAVWNQYFPNEPIVTTPTSTTTSPTATTPNSSGAYVIPAQPNSTANQSSTPPKVSGNTAVTGNNPNLATNTTGQLQPGQKVTQITGGSVYPVQSTPIQPTYTGYVSNAPSWWPSWLPWVFGG